VGVSGCNSNAPVVPGTCRLKFLDGQEVKTAQYLYPAKHCELLCKHKMLEYREAKVTNFEEKKYLGQIGVYKCQPDVVP
jgi:hypothetical protein